MFLSILYFHLLKCLSLLILQNRSSPLEFVTSEVSVDFMKPFCRIGEETKVQGKDDSSNCNKFEGKNNHFTKLWSLIVRTMSFFFISSRYILDSFYFVYNFSWHMLSYLFTVSNFLFLSMNRAYFPYFFLNKSAEFTVNN